MKCPDDDQADEGEDFEHRMIQGEQSVDDEEREAEDEDVPTAFMED